MAGKLIWERTSEASKDLRLVNPGDFDKQEYRRVLEKFISITGSKLGGRLADNLRGLLDAPGEATITFRGDRLGYDGLNRWCATDGTRFTDDEVFCARKVWKFLFGQDNPRTLAKPAGQSGLDIDEGAWNRWYPSVSGSDID
jgi:hypothetical protein